MSELHWFVRDIGITARLDGMRGISALSLDLAERLADRDRLSLLQCADLLRWCKRAQCYVRYPCSDDAMEGLLSALPHSLWRCQFGSAEIEMLKAHLRNGV